MHCARCGFENRQSVSFCEGCGAAFESVCPDCGGSGPRQRRYCGHCGRRLATHPHADSELVAPGDERRNLTVMFCDLLGSTELAQRMDPEDMSALIRAFADAVGRICRRYGAYVAQFLGDGVLCYFGYPRALEDAAERSVRAALDVVEAVQRLPADRGGFLNCRIGIASGEVITGGVIEAGGHADTLAVGSTPNLAARLQALAPAGAIVVANSVFAATRARFEFLDLGAQHLKGYALAQQLWQVRGRRPESAHDATAYRRRVTGRLVGRNTEIATLLQCWRHAARGSGRVVELVGHPGIGKTRLVQALAAHIGDEPHTTVIRSCSAIECDRMLHPIVGYLTDVAGFSASDDPPARLEKLRATFPTADPGDDVVHTAIARLLGLGNTVDSDDESLSPREIKARMLGGLRNWLTRLGRGRPALIVFEDLQWADPTTLEWLAQTIPSIADHPILMVLTARPEFQAPWRTLADVVSLPVGPLSTEHTREVVTGLTGGRSLPVEVMDLLLGRTDGVPLFVEALAANILDTGLLRLVDDRYVLDDPLPSMGIPESLQDSLMARLDRCPQARPIAQAASVIGRQFLVSLLREVAAQDAASVEIALADLAETDLAGPCGPATEPSWEFQHTLVRDAAYHSLLRPRRLELHARTAGTLSAKYSELAESRPELLAHHWSAAGRAEESVALWHRAARQAADAWANTEAVRLYRRAIADVERLPKGSKLVRQELIMQLELGDALRAAQGTSAADTNAAYRRAAELCEQFGDRSLLLRARYGDFITSFTAARLDQAQLAARALLAIGATHEQQAAMTAGHQATGMHAFATGRLHEARDHLEQALRGEQDGHGYRYRHSVPGAVPELSILDPAPARRDRRRAAPQRCVHRPGAQRFALQPGTGAGECLLPAPVSRRHRAHPRPGRPIAGYRP